jgi:hypothetical protein
MRLEKLKVREDISTKLVYLHKMNTRRREIIKDESEKYYKEN